MSFHLEKSVVDFFRERAKNQPNFPAINEGANVLTYGELDAKTDCVAAYLAQVGLRLEEPTAILLPASIDYVVAMLAILKAGGSYLPIDPEAPPKRLEYILQDSASRFVLTNAEGMSRLADQSSRAINVAQITARQSKTPDLAPIIPADPRRRAYVIYTSGSTGQPKGVEIEHHSLTNLICAYHQHLEITARDRTTLFANVAFDVSVADVWPTLCAGGCLVVPPEELFSNPDGLIAWLAAKEITWSFVPTGLIEILFGRPWPAQMSLRLLMTAGDRLRIRPPAGFPAMVINGYGPTENTVISTWSVVTPQNTSTKLPAIGLPVVNVHAYVLDEHQKLVRNGDAGELYLGGVQVARGYIGKPTLTADRFVPDPFTGRPHDRMYRTGDWARWLPDGELDFLGRRDDQVQIRGSRVELGEIEATLLTHPAVRQACCLPRMDQGMAASIVAHIVKTEGLGSDPSAALHSHLAAQLPSYMLPSQFVFHAQLPLTSNGKMDRSALFNLHAKSAESSPQRESADGLEIALSRLWHSLLPEAARFPADAKFCEVGGDSLLMMRLMLSVEEITNQRLEASAFLMHPTFAGLCQAVRDRMTRSGFQPILALRRHGSRPPLFLIYGFDGDIDLYFDLKEALGDDQPVFGIRSPALADASKLPASIEIAAAEVIQSIRQIQPEGAPALIGYSWANLLTFEIARQLEQEDGVSCFTALIGSDAPMMPTDFPTRARHFVTRLPGWIVEFILNPKKWSHRLSFWYLRLTQSSLTKAHLPIGMSSITVHMADLMETYHPPRSSCVSIDFFRDRESFRASPHPLHAWEANKLPDCGWNCWTREEVRVHWFEGDHYTIMRRPTVSLLAHSILQAMDLHLAAPVARVRTLPEPETVVARTAVV